MESETCPTCRGFKVVHARWRGFGGRTGIATIYCPECSGTGRIPTPEKREDQDADRN